MASLPRPGTVNIVIVAIATLGYAAPSHAYLDPGTGSIILQSILASVAVALGFLRLYWHRFKTFLASLTGSSREPESSDNEDIARQSESGNRP